jgi:hypothetical protein
MLIIREATVIKHASVYKTRMLFIFKVRRASIIVLWWTPVVARTSATVWREAPVIIKGSSIMVEASMVRQAPASLPHPLAVLFMCLVHSVEILFVIIWPHFAEWWLISTRRVERRTGRRFDVRTRITPLWRRR